MNAASRATSADGSAIASSGSTERRSGSATLGPPLERGRGCREQLGDHRGEPDATAPACATAWAATPAASVHAPRDLRAAIATSDAAIAAVSAAAEPAAGPPASADELVEQIAKGQLVDRAHPGMFAAWIALCSAA